MSKNRTLEVLGVVLEPSVGVEGALILLRAGRDFLVTLDDVCFLLLIETKIVGLNLKSEFKSTPLKLSQTKS